MDARADDHFGPEPEFRQKIYRQVSGHALLGSAWKLLEQARTPVLEPDRKNSVVDVAQRIGFTEARANFGFHVHPEIPYKAAHMNRALTVA
jgi:hypothetical protein